MLNWFHANRRKLPWREEPTLYKTVVSEFMLQQTQVKTVLPYFARWRERFPDFTALAAAPEETVVKAWEGLGYYSRARNLHKLARALVAAPVAPRTAAEWQELPGVGPHTAAAIASIACGDAVACVDGNVARVLARLTADTTAFVRPDSRRSIAMASAASRGLPNTSSSRITSVSAPSTSAPGTDTTSSRPAPAFSRATRRT